MTGNGFTYERPTSIDEACRLKARFPAYRFIAGGTNLLVQIDKGLAAPGGLISLRALPDLASIREAGRLRIGSTATVNNLIDHDGIKRHYPALAQAAAALGRHSIRNLATIGGNLCNASPAADLAPPLIVLDAVVEIAGPSGRRREIPVLDFFSAPKQTALAADEILTAILLDPAPPGTRSLYLRQGRVQADLALAGVALLLRMEGNVCRHARVAAGAVGPVPLRLRAVEELLVGREPTPEVCERAAAAASTAVLPMTDIRATEDYRRRLVYALTRRGLMELAGHAVEEAPA